MCDRIRCSLALASSLAIAGVVVVPQLAEASQAQGPTARAEHAIAGEVRKVDRATKALVIHTTDGIDETVKFTEQTAVRGVKDVTRLADATAKGSLEGGSVVLHYTGEGIDRTAVAVDHIGQQTLRIAKGTLVRLDETGTFVVIKTAAGVEETFQLTRDLVVDTLRGLEDAARVTSGAIKKGAEVTVHYSDEGGKKVVYLMKHV